MTCELENTDYLQYVTESTPIIYNPREKIQQLFIICETKYTKCL